MDSAEVILTTSSGQLNGSKLTTDTGFFYYSFQGIPYAKPPVGDLRFKAPQPLAPWTGILDATKDAKVCCQINLFFKKYQGEEDCLYLNVYTPKLPAPGTRKLPVIFNIHGGGFKMGSGNTDMYGPDFLVEQNIILVTCNYRLGVLGFLSLENEKVPGNAGLKDQLAALRWVHKNISVFGGDPNNVTLFGSSSGAASVHYMMLNENNKGLFHKAICCSGTAINSWALQVSPLKVAFELCSVLGHKTNDVEDAFIFLKSLPARSLIEGHEKMLEPKEFSNLLLIFLPVIENVYPNEEAVITEHPEKILYEGRYIHVPCIFGYNKGEGIMCLRANTDYVNPEFMEGINQDFRKYIEISNIESNKLTKLAPKIKEFYFGNAPVSIATLESYVELKGDLIMIYLINKAVKIHSKDPKNPVYYYRFSLDKMGLFKTLMSLNVPGVSHGDELGYFFKIKGYSLKDPEMLKTSEIMVRMWTNFAKTGNPTPGTKEWKCATPEELNYLDIDKHMSLKQNPESKRIQFWEEIYKTD